jgi:hypothetical protein
MKKMSEIIWCQHQGFMIKLGQKIFNTWLKTKAAKRYLMAGHKASPSNYGFFFPEYFWQLKEAHDNWDDEQFKSLKLIHNLGGTL